MWERVREWELERDSLEFNSSLHLFWWRCLWINCYYSWASVSSWVNWQQYFLPRIIIVKIQWDNTGKEQCLKWNSKITSSPSSTPPTSSSSFSFFSFLFLLLPPWHFRLCFRIKPKQRKTETKATNLGATQSLMTLLENLDPAVPEAIRSRGLLLPRADCFPFCSEPLDVCPLQQRNPDSCRIWTRSVSVSSDECD